MCHLYGESKPVAQLCHGPLIPAAVGVLNGRKSSAYTTLAPDIRADGAEFPDGDAVIDGNVVSGRATRAGCAPS